uniref:collagen alpha-1(XII) chain-like isoform X2 n=1 Tax=Myxine glutinosa TaxID=7769 RepID=UPI00358DE6C1
MEVGSDKVRVALMQYTGNEESRLHFNLDTLTSNAAILRALNTTKFRKSSMTTKTSTDESFVSLFQRKSRTDVPKILILFTDGTNHGQFETPLHRLRDVNVHTFVVGVGKLDTNPLRRIASLPVDEHLILVDSFSELYAAINKLTSAVRKVIKVIEITIANPHVLPQDVHNGTLTVLVPLAELGNKDKTTVEPETSDNGKNIIATTLSSFEEGEPGATVGFDIHTTVVTVIEEGTTPSTIPHASVVVVETGETTSAQEIIPEVQTNPEEMEISSTNLGSVVAENQATSIPSLAPTTEEPIQVDTAPPTLAGVLLPLLPAPGTATAPQISPEDETTTGRTHKMHQQGDLVFLVDFSNNIGDDNFMKVTEFLTGFLDKLEVGPSKVRVALVQYTGSGKTSTTQIRFNLDTLSDKSSIMSVLRDIKLINESRPEGDSTEDSLSAVFHPKGRGNIPKILILLTDGTNNDKFEAPLQSLIDTHVNTFVVAVGNVEKTRLKRIVSSPDEQHIILVDNFSRLDTVIEKLTYSVDKVIETTEEVIETSALVLPQILVTETPTVQNPLAVEINQLATTPTLGSTEEGEPGATVGFDIHTTVGTLIEEGTAPPAIPHAPVVVVETGGTTSAQDIIPEVQSNPEETTTLGSTEEGEPRATVGFDIPTTVGTLIEEGTTPSTIPHTPEVVVETGGTTSAQDIIPEVQTNPEEMEISSTNLGSVVAENQATSIPSLAPTTEEPIQVDTAPPTLAGVLLPLLPAPGTATAPQISPEDETTTGRTHKMHQQGDLVFLVDFSNNIGDDNFVKVTEFLTGFLDKLEVGPSKVRVALVQYTGSGKTSTTQIRFNLDTLSDKSSIMSVLRDIKLINESRPEGDSTEDSLSAVFHPKGRGNIPKILILLTDGTNNDKFEAPLQRLIDTHVNTFVVAVGNVEKTRLKRIVSSPDEQHIILVDNFSRLDTVIEKLTYSVDKVIETTEEVIETSAPVLPQILVTETPTVQNPLAVEINQLATTPTLGSTEESEPGATVGFDIHTTVGTLIEEGTAPSTIPHAPVVVVETGGTTSAQEIIPEVQTNPEEKISATTLSSFEEGEPGATVGTLIEEGTTPSTIPHTPEVVGETGGTTSAQEIIPGVQTNPKETTTLSSFEEGEPGATVGTLIEEGTTPSTIPHTPEVVVETGGTTSAQEIIPEVQTNPEEMEISSTNLGSVVAENQATSIPSLAPTTEEPIQVDTAPPTLDGVLLPLLPAPGTATAPQISPEDETTTGRTHKMHQQGDLVFLVDFSNNIGDDNFVKVTEFLTGFLGKLEVGPSKVRVALVQYTGSGKTSTTQIRFNLDTLSDKSSIMSVLRDIKLINESRPEGDSTEDSLSAVFHPKGRGNIPKILILLTDGTNNDKFEAPLQRLIDTHVKTFVVAVGNVEKTRLKRIVSSPDEQHIILVDNFSRLDTVIEKLTYSVDKVIETTEEVIETSAPVLPQILVTETPTVQNPLAVEINQLATTPPLRSTEEGEPGATVSLEAHVTLANSRDLLLLIDSPSLSVSDFLLLRAALLSNLQLLLPRDLSNNRLIVIQAASLPRLEFALGPSANIGIDTVVNAILNMKQATGSSCNLSDAVRQGLQLLKGPNPSRDQSIIIITGGPCMDTSAAASMLQASGIQIFTLGPHDIYSNLAVLASEPSHYHFHLVHSFAHVYQPLFYTLAQALLGPHLPALLSSAEVMNKDQVPSHTENQEIQKPGTHRGISASLQVYLSGHIKEISCEDKARDVLSMDNMVVICPGNCQNITDYKVYGQDVYSLDSMVCLAGIHFGLLPPWGGWLHMSRLRVNKALLSGAPQHGVRSLPGVARNAVFFFQNCPCAL